MQAWIRAVIAGGGWAEAAESWGRTSEADEAPRQSLRPAPDTSGSQAGSQTGVGGGGAGSASGDSKDSSGEMPGMEGYLCVSWNRTGGLLSGGGACTHQVRLHVHVHVKTRHASHLPLPPLPPHAPSHHSLPTPPPTIPSPRPLPPFPPHASSHHSLPTPLLSGFRSKQSGGKTGGNTRGEVLKKWDRRYFVLRAGTTFLRYYKVSVVQCGE